MEPYKPKMLPLDCIDWTAIVMFHELIDIVEENP